MSVLSGNKDVRQVIFGKKKWKLKNVCMGDPYF